MFTDKKPFSQSLEAESVAGKRPGPLQVQRAQTEETVQHRTAARTSPVEKEILSPCYSDNGVSQEAGY